MFGNKKSRPPPWHPLEWPEPSLEPRILIEDADGASRWATRRMLERSGFEVAECPGPNGWRCPMPRGESCPIVDGADAIVFSLNPRSIENAQILQAHRTYLSHRPVCVEITAPEADAHTDLIDGLVVIDPSGLGDLVPAIANALKKTGSLKA